MSVLVKGMEMPTSCGDCRFHKSVYCTLTDICTNTAQGCPLVPVPDHGRLIDADKVQDEWFNLNFNRRISDGTLAYWNFQLSKAPTIIPADKEGEDG